jgi:hypothetical protein
MNSFLRGPCRDVITETGSETRQSCTEGAESDAMESVKT